jgi:pectinesterase
MRRRKFLELAGGSTAGAVLATAAGSSAASAASAARPAPPFGVVAADGSGDFTTVQAAIDAVPVDNAERRTILIRPGTYLGQVVVPSTKPLITLAGTGRSPEDVVIADDRANGTPKPDGSGTWGTSGSASVTVDGAEFNARNLTFANLFDEAAHPEITGTQAVAILTRTDKLQFERVRFLANQDTLYVNSKAAGTVGRVYLRDCYVEGDVDFIFGRASAYFDRCHVHSLNRNSTPAGYVTAPSTDISIPYGLVFNRCKLTSDAPPASVFLGRPWHSGNDANAIGQTIIRDSWIGDHIGATAWSDFGTWPWRDARLVEYHNRGPGALITDDRPQLTDEQATLYTAAAVLSGTDDWRPDLCD